MLFSRSPRAEDPSVVGSGGGGGTPAAFGGGRGGGSGGCPGCDEGSVTGSFEESTVDMAEAGA